MPYKLSYKERKNMNDRIAARIIEAKEYASLHPEEVEIFRKLDRDDPDRPEQCNRVTNSPCAWSETPYTEDICKVCKRKFASW
jgi:hypothetical protein